MTYVMLLIRVLTSPPLGLQILSLLPSGNGTHHCVPEMNFGVSLGSKLLVAISQREVTCFYPPLFLRKKDNLQILIHDFFVDNVQESFELDNYTFDVYVTRDGRVKLIDFNPWGAFTLPLMFTWEELEDFERGEKYYDF
ncbi:hypothetical protein Scep_015728 [Stephania cephalantha]|uniref:Cell division cycle protein 123 homolog n=1 Tax=Stephania cephalantha TaxID=152367 RepID=A0AAP0J3C4_9MAGN